MKYVKPFSAVTKNDASEAGGKGASLGEMTHAGIRVPPGFVVLVSAFEHFLAATDLNVEIESALDAVNHKEMHTIERASETIKALILSSDIPKKIERQILEAFSKLNTKFVAVRSSATAEDSASAAWAGQLETYLNTTKIDLLENVKKCWASLFTPRAIFYRFEKELHKHKISVAVVVQKMMESETSGIAFSVHPVTQDRNQMIIEAGFGLGEAIVSGQITPDSYVVEKQPRRILDTNVQTQTKALVRANGGGNRWRDLPTKKGTTQVLSNTQILKLSDLILRIESHYGFPCDIEWAFEKRKFYILQSRPITTLEKQLQKNALPDPEKYLPFTKHTGFASYFSAFGFFVHIMDLGGLVLFDGTSRRTYIQRSVTKRTLREGFRLYSSQSKYKKLQLDLRTAFNDVHKKGSVALKKFSKATLQHLFDAADAFSLLYRFSEWFYTESAYHSSKNNKSIRQNLRTFERFKLEGRRMVNAMSYAENSVLQRILKKAARTFNIPLPEIKMYKGTELLTLFEGQRVSHGLLAQRKRCYGIYFDKGKIIELAGSDASSLLDAFAVKKIRVELYGQTAHKGIVTGRARVATLHLERFFSASKIIREIKKGEILVADTTIPEILPACKKAAAIVTNQGGMLSHAAIVSRELNIPCIVGTENATELIHTGDRIEVDANRGVVRMEKVKKL